MKEKKENDREGGKNKYCLAASKNVQGETYNFFGV